MTLLVLAQLDELARFAYDFALPALRSAAMARSALRVIDGEIGRSTATRSLFFGRRVDLM